MYVKSLLFLLFGMYPVPRNGTRDTKWTNHRADFCVVGVRGDTQWYDVAVVNPTFGCNDHVRPLSAAKRKEAAKANHYAKIREDYESDSAVNPTPWPLVAPVVPLIFETFGGSSLQVAALVRHCACNFESSIASGYSPSARSRFISRYMRELSSVLFMQQGDALLNGPLGNFPPPRPTPRVSSFSGQSRPRLWGADCHSPRLVVAAGPLPLLPSPPSSPLSNSCVYPHVSHSHTAPVSTSSNKCPRPCYFDSHCPLLIPPALELPPPDPPDAGFASVGVHGVCAHAAAVLY